MANFQKHAGNPASSRHVVVVAMTNWLLRSAREFVDGRPMVKRYLECFHALDKLSGFVRVGLSDSTSSHEVLHRSHNIFSVLGWRGVALDGAGKPVSNDKNLLDRVIAQLCRLASIHEVKGDEVAELCELLTECTSICFVVLHLSSHTRVAVRVLVSMCQQVFKSTSFMFQGTSL